jgi:CheY-like chemotaxis protein
MNLIDIEQIAKIQEFKKKHQDDGLFVTLQDEAELALRLRDELELRFARIINKPDGHSDARATQSGSPSMKSILWVDNHPENNSYGRDFFENNGVEVGIALSTDQALSLLEHNSYAVIISDMGRREGPSEGYVLLDELRRRGNNTPFIIFAGSNNLEHKIETEQHGGNGCTNSFSELFTMVTSIMLRTL